MKLCVFGASGQLGKELLAPGISPYQVVGFDEIHGDVTSLEVVRDIIQREAPDVVVNCAAYTAVDKAEEEREIAFAVNEGGAKNLAIAAKEFSTRLITVSTDYVFGGDSQQQLCEPIKEESPSDPCNVYGASKRAGELAALEVYPEGTLVVRTSSLHGAYGANFVHTILRLLEEREELSVVNDQYMAPTWAGWLAHVLLELSSKEITGYLHASSRGAITWYQFAEAIRNMAQFSTQAPAILHPITTRDYPTPARRPRYSVLDCSKLDRIISGVVIDWEEGLRAHLQELGRVSFEQVAQETNYGGENNDD